MHKVALLAYDGFAAFEMGCATELFALARPELPGWYHAEVVSFESGPLRTVAGMQVTVATIVDLEAYNTLVVPSWPVDDAMPARELRNAVLSFYAKGGRILSFCSGAFLLAELGLLEGRMATTHWRYAETFQQRYPDVHYKEDVLYLFDGRIGCSAGSAAAIDLGMEVIRRDHGHDIANQVARRLVMYAHRAGGQSQFVEAPVSRRPDAFAETLDWAQARLGEALPVGRLAEKAHMSRRSFDRRFRKALNMSPQEWLIRQRIILARSLLECSQRSLDTIAAEVGFGSTLTMRHHFKRLLGVAPGQYRRQFSKESADSFPF